ncbi:MAG: ArsR family transcriptional regulator [Phycisphaera sp.]|nr:MAG: ArsR family transcriptional regulator [Phycisphaera sp.]
MVIDSPAKADRDRLNLVFAALSDPIRRGMLEQLAAGETSISRLAEPYDVSQPAISKHMRVLERAGLISRTKQGREHRIRVNTAPIEQARGWIGVYARLWKEQFDAVDEYLKIRRKRKGHNT